MNPGRVAASGGRALRRSAVRLPRGRRALDGSVLTQIVVDIITYAEEFARGLHEDALGAAPADGSYVVSIPHILDGVFSNNAGTCVGTITALTTRGGDEPDELHLLLGYACPSARADSNEEGSAVGLEGS